MSENRFASLRRVSGDVSRETFEKLEEFERVFLHWAIRINLSAPSTLNEVWSRHILDSAQLGSIAAVREANSWVDIGSGGGFPGAVLAILADGRKPLSITLVESNSKKAAFLRNSLANLAPDARIICARAEAYVSENSPPDAVSARAVASLPLLLALCEPWLSQKTVGFFHKGRDYREELKLAHDTWNLDLVEHRSAIDAESVVLEIRSIRRKV